jgi:uncharacterized protein
MYFHVFLTTECDLQCKYCYGKACEDIDSDFPFAVDYSLPREIDYNIDVLAAFCEQDPHCVLSFYGGEPTLRLDVIREIMDNVQAEHFLMQTNGLHLDKLEPEYTDRLHTILVSVDGGQELTDYYRGVGVYKRVMDNLRFIRLHGFPGELVARMTVMEETNIFNEVQWLLQNPDVQFSSIHWQLDAGFWRNDFANRSFQQWVEHNYNPSICKLVRFWVDEMEHTGTVLRLYPFVGLMQSLLRAERSALRCGSGWINYTILTDGSIAPCPAMQGMRDFYAGHISTTNPRDLKRIFVAKPCTDCTILDICGGRCLYANITRRWDADAYSIVCNTVRNLISALKQEMPRVERLIAEGRINRDDFDYLKYNGCEIIP